MSADRAGDGDADHVDHADDEPPRTRARVRVDGDGDADEFHIPPSALDAALPPPLVERPAPPPAPGWSREGRLPLSVDAHLVLRVSLEVVRVGVDVELAVARFMDAVHANLDDATRNRMTTVETIMPTAGSRNVYVVVGMRFGDVRAFQAAIARIGGGDGEVQFVRLDAVLRMRDAYAGAAAIAANGGRVTSELIPASDARAALSRASQARGVEWRPFLRGASYRLDSL